jgi:hypothetical protein
MPGFGGYQVDILRQQDEASVPGGRDLPLQVPGMLVAIQDEYEWGKRTLQIAPMRTETLIHTTSSIQKCPLRTDQRSAAQSRGRRAKVY